MKIKQTFSRVSILLAFLVVALGSFWGAPQTSRAQGTARLFPETDKSVNGTLLAYWDTHGSLSQQGYPITQEMQEQSDSDGQTYTMQ